MRRVRRQLSRLAAGWLVLQLAVVAPMPVALCAGLAADAAGAECTCSHGPGVACPMHHAASGRDSTSCSCRGTTDDTSLLASLFDTAALLTAPGRTAMPLANVRPLPPVEFRPIEHPAVPDAPPPRA